MLVVQLGGGITEKKKSGLFNDAKSMPQIIEALNKAAHDPRVSGIYLKLERLDLGWGKVQVPTFEYLTVSMAISIWQSWCHGDIQHCMSCLV